MEFFQSWFFAYTLFGVVFILIILRVVKDAPEADIVLVPDTVYFHDPFATDDRQKIFDWLVYVVKLGGVWHLRELTWRDGHPETPFLLIMQNAALTTYSQAKLLKETERIGESFGLDTSRVFDPV